MRGAKRTRPKPIPTKSRNRKPDSAEPNRFAMALAQLAGNTWQSSSKNCRRAEGHRRMAFRRTCHGFCNRTLSTRHSSRPRVQNNRNYALPRAGERRHCRKKTRQKPRSTRRRRLFGFAKARWPQMKKRQCSTALGFILYCRRDNDKSRNRKNGRAVHYSPDFNGTSSLAWAIFRISSVIRIEQYLGPHMLQKWALLKVSWGSVSS